MAIQSFGEWKTFFPLPRLDKRKVFVVVSWLNDHNISGDKRYTRIMPRGELPEVWDRWMNVEGKQSCSQFPTSTGKEAEKINFEFEEYKRQTKRDSRTTNGRAKGEKTFRLIKIFTSFKWISYSHRKRRRAKSCGAIEKGSKGKFAIIKVSASHSPFQNENSRKLFLMRKRVLIIVKA